MVSVFTRTSSSESKGTTATTGPVERNRELVIKFLSIISIYYEATVQVMRI